MTALYQNLDVSLKGVWADTPWMVNHPTGSINGDRYEQIYEWLSDRYGRARCPIGRNDGNWRMGSATVGGYTWLGFATEKAMREFMGAWT